MPVLQGPTSIGGLFIGSGAAARAYLGASLVWEAGGGTTPPPSSAPALRAVNGGYSQNSAGSTATVSTPTATAVGDTLFAVRSLNYAGLNQVTNLPTGAGVTWELLDTIAGGNVALGLYRGVVTTAGARTVSFTTTSDSSQFAIVRTYEGSCVLDAYSETGAASATTLTIPGVTTTGPAQVFGAWTTVQFNAASTDGSALQLPAGMTGRLSVPGDSWVELMAAHADVSAAGATGAFSSSLVIGGTTRAASAGWAGMLVAVKRA